ncbi:hypothetical protein FHW68_000849 [Pseudomonas sp. Tn43]|uniref:hypothetical protein n=1 Tax=Pseudomonas sp. Tn43 TaxID=701213 RepID=UPI00161A078C|nr:hypothetical protein [Pseudomonas sp. Tn43]MBB3239377.1 hypothetical protein [Pseudomonas sp. Tn43]
MSHSEMKATYNSYPDRYVFKVESMDESSGKFSGIFQEHSCNVELVTGWFNFNDAAKCTDLKFSSNTDSWSLKARYESGERYFEEWSAIRTSKSGSIDTENIKFYMDMSDHGTSWFGDTDWWGKGHM